MEIVIETPKWSFVKYRKVGDKFRRALVSPFPTLFNYGFVIGDIGGDGECKDVLVLGGRLPRGFRLNSGILGNVQFVDDNIEDDKLVASLYGGVSTADKVKISLFFKVYAIYKTIYYLLTQKRLTVCRYRGYYFK